MPEELETILRLVAEGKLSPEDASPIIDALTRAERSAAPDRRRDREDRRTDRIHRRMERAGRRLGQAFARADEHISEAQAAISGGGSRQLRIRVTEHGRQVVNLRIPIGFVDAALQFVPGLAGDQSQRIRDAVNAGTTGPILDVEDPDGDGVLISVE
jgi:hypothetical protein